MQWYSIADLVGLPGLPTDKGSLVRKAKRENWRSRDRHGQGGGKEYYEDSLPDETRQYLKQQRIERIRLETQEQELSVFRIQRDYWKAEFEGLEETEFKGFGKLLDPRFQAHLEIQQKYERWLEINCDKFSNKLAAQVGFCDLYNAHELDISERTYELVPTLSRATLLRKRAQMGKEGLTALEDRRGRNRKGCGLIDSFPGLAEKVKEVLAAGIFAPQKILSVLKHYFDGIPWLPTVGQIRYWVQNFATNNPVLMSVFRSKDSSPAFGRRDLLVHEPNQEWQIDSSATDVMLKFQDEDGSWKKRRYAVLACVDVYTRRAKVFVSDRSRSEAILELLKRAICDWGVPQQVTADNGKDYASERTEDFLKLLEIDLHHCDPYKPDQKPFVERFFRTFHEATELFPGYVGHSVAERERLRKRADWDEKTVDLELTAEEFQAWGDRWCEDYHQRHHQGIECSPLEALTEAIADGWQPKHIEHLEKRRILDMLSLRGADRKIQSQGIQINGRYYVSSELYNIGAAVHIRYDEADPYRIYIFKDAKLSEFICEAVWRDWVEPEKLAEIAVQANEQHKVTERYGASLQTLARRRRKQIAQDPAKALKPNNVEELARKSAHETVAVTVVGTSITEKPFEPQLPTPEELELYEKEKAVRLEREEWERAEAERRAKRDEEDQRQRDRYKELYYKQLKGGELNDEELNYMRLIERQSRPEAIAWQRRTVENGWWIGTG